MEDTAQWVRRMQDGDESAFDLLFTAWQSKALRTAWLICGSKALAEDVVQEAFVLCLLHIGELKDPMRFKPWFYRILTRCAWGFLKKSRWICEWSERMERYVPSALDTCPSDRFDYECLYRALDSLGTKQRTAVVLFYFSGLSVKEIARATASPEATVKTRLFAARKQLQKRLKEDVYEQI